ncbi:hypothetical protein [Nonomuraea sp. B1E8]|uniref:TlpA family protein disulfide reductase n=1 Tax=unclassified Nonomuraea TaxID=2593643 RepID=UPI00325D7CAE
MNAVLTAAVAIIGALCGLNLLLMLAVLRRLRDDKQKSHDPLAERGLVPETGTRVTDFTATTIDGDEVSTHGLDGPLLTGFFSSGCPSCRDELPAFVKFAGALPGGRERSLVVLAGSAEEGADIIDAVREVSRVVVEPLRGPVESAFGVRVWPSFVVLAPRTARSRRASPVSTG